MMEIAQAMHAFPGSLINRGLKYLTGGWREATVYFIVVLIYIRKYEAIILKLSLCHNQSSWYYMYRQRSHNKRQHGRTHLGAIQILQTQFVWPAKT